MGFDLKGKDLGPNISQRKRDGRYRARFTMGSGKILDRNFDTVDEAKAWLRTAQYEDDNQIPIVSGKTTVNEVYHIWIQNKAFFKRPNTVRNYKTRYYFNIKPEIGSMNIADVKPFHCQGILNKMVDDYATSTIKQTFITLQNLFLFAYENDYIRKSPVTRSGVILPEGEEAKPIDYFTAEEQKMFLQVAKDYSCYEQFALMLMTGMRISEVIGLKWENVDLENRTITVANILEYRYSRRIEAERAMAKSIAPMKKGKHSYNGSPKGEVRADGWYWGPPKTVNGFRTFKITTQTVELLRRLECRPYLRDETPEEFRDLVFLGERNGLPIRNNTYDNKIRKLIDIMTDEINDGRRSEGLEPIEPHYLSCHDFRHTFATRFIESSKSSNYAKVYKSLSKRLGHSSTRITIDLYSHLTEDTEDELIDDFELYLDECMKLAN